MSDFQGQLSGAQIDALPGNIQSLQEQLGSLPDLTTDAKDNLVAAINEVAAREQSTTTIVTQLANLVSESISDKVDCTLSMSMGAYLTESISLQFGDTLLVESNFDTHIASADYTDIYFDDDNCQNYSFSPSEDMTVVIIGDKNESMEFMQHKISYRISKKAGIAAIKDSIANNSQLITELQNKVNGESDPIECPVHFESSMVCSETIELAKDETIHVTSSFPTQLDVMGGDTLSFDSPTNYTYAATEDISVIICGPRTDSSDINDYSVSYTIKSAASATPDLSAVTAATEAANTAAASATSAAASATSAATSATSAATSADNAAAAANAAAALATQAAQELLDKETESIHASMNLDATIYLTEYITLKAGQTITVESSFPTKLSALGGEELTSEFATNYTYTATEETKVTIWGNQGESTNPADYQSAYSVKTPSEISELKSAIQQNASDISANNTAIFNLQQSKIDLPSGGTTGQVLTKTDDGVEWGDGSYVDPGQGGSATNVDFLTETTSLVIEESANPAWTRGCSLNIIENIINADGSYVIDPINKKYARLSSADHRKFADGTAWDGTYGEAFRRFPQVFYLIRTNSAQQKVLYLSLKDLGSGSWPETWTGIYKGSVDANGLHSRPALLSTQSKTMKEFWDAAQLVSEDMGLVSYLDHCKLGALHLVKFGNANSSFSMGHGLQDAGSAYYAHTTGYTAALGDGTGELPYADTEHKMNKLFGIEDLSGGTFEFRSGIRFDDTHSIVYSGNRVSNTAKDTDVDYVRTFERNTDLFASYTKRMAIGSDFDLIPVEGGGSNATYWCDAAWSQSSGKVLFVGGSSYGGNFSGLYGAHSYRPYNYSSQSVGARLAFRGDISEYELVSGAVLAALHA